MSTELEKIEQVMRSEPAAYWQDGGMQSRYQSLLAEQNPEAVLAHGEGPEPLSVQEARSGFDLAGGELSRVASEWESVGNFPQALRAVQGAVMNIVSGIPERDQRAFMERFDGLPEKARGAIYMELALGKMNFIPEASEAAVADFASTPERGRTGQGMGPWRRAPGRHRQSPMGTRRGCHG